MNVIAEGEIAEGLKPTGEYLRRWAIQAFDWEPRKTSSTWRAMQAAAGVLLEPGHPPEMDKDIAVVARIMSECKASRDDYWVYSVCYVHFCETGSSAQKARRLLITRTRYYELRNLALMYLKGRFEGVGLDV